MPGKKSSISYIFADSAAPLPPTSKIVRPPVPHRERHDFKGDAMREYINDLEMRMVGHMRKHAPHWVDKESNRVHWRWTRPALNHPAPHGSTPRDVRQDARDYAAALVKERLVAKMGRLNDIRVARYLGGYKQVDPLHLIFHDRTTDLRKAMKQKPEM